MENLWLILITILSYFFGSFPTAKIVTHKKITIAEWGHDSWGTMSALQKTGSYSKGALVLIGDILKGFLPVFFAIFLAQFLGYSVLVALFLSSAGTVLGHCHSIFNHWYGGRGLATGFGVMLAVNWVLGLACLGTLITFILITEFWMQHRFVGGFKKIIRDNLLGRIIGIVLCLAVVYGMVGLGSFCALLPMMALIIFSHLDRIKIFVKENKEVLFKRLSPLSRRRKERP